jgi:hypothetical protein
MWIIVPVTLFAAPVGFVLYFLRTAFINHQSTIRFVFLAAVSILLTLFVTISSSYQAILLHSTYGFILCCYLAGWMDG